MKKTMASFLILAILFALSACGTTEESVPDTPESTTEERVETEESFQDEEETSSIASSEQAEETNILIAYFSWAENAVLAEDVDAITSPSVIAPGNVQQLAAWVQEETEGDIFSIQVTDPYPSDWDECLERANQERGENARPELVGNVENMENYDVVFLGYPNWWYGVPMALLSFLENNDLQVYLFCSHGTGGLANSVEIITEAASGAEISDDIFDCYEEDAASSKEAIIEWVNGLRY